MMSKRVLFFTIGLLFCEVSQAQKTNDIQLQERLQGKTKFADIIVEVDRHYRTEGNTLRANANTNEPEFEGDEYLNWNRWAYWARRRLNPDKTLADYKILNKVAVEETEARFTTQLSQARLIHRNTAPLNERMIASSRNIDIPSALRSYGGWTLNGPIQQTPIIPSNIGDINGLGRLDRIAFHPTNANIFYVCSPSGGVFKTSNGGTSWTDVSEGLPGGVACLEVSKSAPNVIYAVTGDGDSHSPGFFVYNNYTSPVYNGVYKSTDGGATWNLMGDMYTGTNLFRAFNIAVSPFDENLLFVATNRGLYRSTDGAATFQMVENRRPVFDVKFATNSDTRVYAATDSTVLYSASSGIAGTWVVSSLASSTVTRPRRIALGVADNIGGFPNSTSNLTVYAFVSNSDRDTTGRYAGLFVSTNGGATFSMQNSTPNILGSSTNGSDNSSSDAYCHSMTVKPTNTQVLLTANLTVWRSTNAGSIMVNSTTYREGMGPLSKYIHPDVHEVRYNPADQKVYACTDGGVYVSADDGVTWTDLSAGIAATQFYHFGMADSDGDGEVDPSAIIGGAQDNGIKYRDNSLTWSHKLCCDGWGGVMHSTDNKKVFIVMNNNIFFSNDIVNAGLINSGRRSAPISSIAIDHNTNMVYIAAPLDTFGCLIRTADWGVAFDTVVADVSNFITTCPSNSNVLYAGPSGRIINQPFPNDTTLLRSTNKGITWSTISGNTGWPTTNPVISVARAHPLNSSIVYVAFSSYDAGDKVYRSSDGGATWTNFSGSLPNVPVHSLAPTIEGLYAGTEIGVFFRPSGSADWQPFYTGMPRVIVTDIFAAENGLLYAGTFGRGIWHASRYSTCEADLSLSGNLAGPHYYETSNSITVTSTVNAGQGTDVFTKSNGYVDLKPGFEVKSGSFFKAYLGPCGNGIPTPLRNAYFSEPMNRVIELTNKVDLLKTSNIDYYKIEEDGILLNLESDQQVSIELIDQATQQKVSLIPNLFIRKGLYKIVTGEGHFKELVKVGSTILQRVQ